MPKEGEHVSFSPDMYGLYSKLFRPLLFMLDPERAHQAALRILPLLPHRRKEPDRSIETSLAGIPLRNPIGLAAGFDKDGVAAEHLTRLGFGFLELGTVTPLPQPGNPRPRLFRFPAKRALVNRMGFNNLGGEALATRIRHLRDDGRANLPLGINIGKQRETPPEEAAADYRKLIDLLLPVADYLVVNVSSPNTPGLRKLERADLLGRLLEEIREAAVRRAARQGIRTPPLLVKLSPDMGREELGGAAAAALDSGMDAIIVSNTTVDLGSLGGNAPSGGGLSGEPLREKALEAIRIVRKATSGSIPLVGSGGIFDAEDVYRRIRAGASVVQVYTGLIYEGPDMIWRILAKLPLLMARDGFATIEEAVGTED